MSLNELFIRLSLNELCEYQSQELKAFLEIFPLLFREILLTLQFRVFNRSVANE